MHVHIYNIHTYIYTHARYLRAIRTGRNHVGFKERPFKKHMVVVERLVDRREHRLSDGLGHHQEAPVNVVWPVCEHLQVNDGHQPVLLADDGVAGQALSILLDGQLQRLGGADLKDGTPLGEVSAGLVVLAAPGAEGIKALSGGLTVGSGELDGDAVLLEDLDEGLAVGGFLVECLLEEDDAGEVGEGVGVGEEELP